MPFLSLVLLAAMSAQPPAAAAETAPAVSSGESTPQQQPQQQSTENKKKKEKKESGKPVAEPADQAASPDAGTPGYHEEVTVTATRYQVDSFDTPTPISVISQQDLEQRNPEKIMDALKLEPGIEVAGEGPFRGLPVIRGLSSNRVLILVDGQRLNNSRESTEFAGIQPGLVDLSQVERIEVLRGPASVLYGSDALGGVINIITKQPSFSAQGFTLGGTAAFTYGTAADSRNGQLDLNGATERATFRLAASAADVSDYKSPEGTVPNSGMKQRNVSGGMRLLLTEKSFLRVDLQSVRASDIGFPGYDPATSGVDISFPHFDRDKLSVAYDLADLAGMHSITVNAYYQGVTKESKRNLDFGPYFFSHNFTTSDIDTVGLNAQAQASLGINHLTFGVDSYQDRLHDDTVADSTFGSSTEVAVPDSRQRGIGAYLQDLIPASSRFQFQIGVRGDNYTFVSFQDARYTGDPFDVSDSAFSGSVSARYQVTSAVALDATVGRGFRAPNVQERSYFGLATTGDTWIEQNPDLASETSLNYEMGFKVRYARYSGGLTVYHNDVRDLIALVFLGEDPVTGLQLAKFDNIDRATIRGAEFDLESYLTEKWTAFGNISYTRGDNNTLGQPLDYIPPVKGVVGVRYQIPKWWSEFSLRAVGAQTRVPTLPEPGTPSPGFTVYDLRGGVNLPHGLMLQLAVENLTDKAYHEPFNVRLEPGRNFRMSVAYTF
jgi:hemoglobin/transferrin/lactoferrin receptor protein